ncbi:MAG: alpha/beta hydrolase [Propionicimonas sp.]
MKGSEEILARQKTRVRFRSGDMDFIFSYMLGVADLLGAHGPLFAAAGKVRDASASDWRREFFGLADRAHRHAGEAGGDEEARQWALTDCYANRAGLQFTDPTTAEFGERWQRMEDAFMQAMRRWQAPVTAIEVPFETGSLPGYLLKLDDEPRPAIVMIGGGDTSREDLFVFGGLPAWQHGFNAIMVDLPGQGKAPSRGLTYIADMQRPIATVVDRLFAEIPSTTRLAAYGVSGGGYFSCQAVASDPRIDAWIAATPIFDIADVFRKEFGAALQVPGRLQQLLIGIAGRVNEAADINLKRYAFQFGTSDFVTAVTEVLRRVNPVDLTTIDTPALFLYSAGEGDELRRQTEVAEAILIERGVPVTVRCFSAVDGADAHCQVNNLRLAHAIIFDWLGERFVA